MTPFISLRRTFLLLTVVAVTCGCSRRGYTLEGRAVESKTIGVRFVDQEDRDPALIPGIGVPGTRIEVIRDPRSLGRKVVATGRTDGFGVFVISIDAFGAGWMDEEWLFRFTHPRHQVIELFDSLPAKNADRVLVVDMGNPGAPGSGNRPIDEDDRIRRELERFGP